MTVHIGLYTSDIGWGRDSILCTKQFIGSDSVSLRLSRGRHGRLPPLLVAASCGDMGIWCC